MADRRRRSVDGAGHPCDVVFRWGPRLPQLDRMVADGVINASDLDFLLVTDDVDAAVEYVRSTTVDCWRLAKRRRPIMVVGKVPAPVL